MAKTRRATRPQRKATTTTSRPAASTRPPDAALATSEALTRLLANAGDIGGGIITESGVVHRSGRLRGAPRGSGWRWDVPAPPAGKVLWVYFAFDWQIFTWDSWGPGNNSSSQLRVDFGITWAWNLMTNPYVFPQPNPVFLQDAGRYEFYSSVPPGGSGFNAAWIAPARSVTLTPDSKESNPNLLALLLQSRRNGIFPLWSSIAFSDEIINGHEAHGYTIDGGADTLYYAYAVIPRYIDVPDVNVGELVG
jgi:hypothetical protein